jgi:hypothetical protein
MVVAVEERVREATHVSSSSYGMYPAHHMTCIL